MWGSVPRCRGEPGPGLLLPARMQCGACPPGLSAFLTLSSVSRVLIQSLALSWCHSGHLHIVYTHCPHAAGSLFTGAQLAKQKYTPAMWISSSLPEALAESSPRKEMLPVKTTLGQRSAGSWATLDLGPVDTAQPREDLCTSHGLHRLIFLRSGCRGGETRRRLPPSRGRQKPGGFCPCGSPLLEAWGQETLQLSQGVGLPTSLFLYFSILDKQLTFLVHVFFDCLGFTSVSSSFDLGAWWQICSNHHWQEIFSHPEIDLRIRLTSGENWIVPGFYDFCLRISNWVDTFPIPHSERWVKVISHTHTHTHTCPTAQNSLVCENNHKTGDFLSTLSLPQTTAHHCLPFSDAKTKHHPFSYSKHVTVILISKPQPALDPHTFILYSKWLL